MPPKPPTQPWVITVHLADALIALALVAICGAVIGAVFAQVEAIATANRAEATLAAAEATMDSAAKLRADIGRVCPCLILE